MGEPRRKYNFIHPQDGNRAGRRTSHSKDGLHQDDPSIFVERMKLEAARLQQSEIARMMHDPPPGYSALDAKRKEKQHLP